MRRTHARLAVVAMAVAACCPARQAAAATDRTLTVCADPGNLPYSDAAGEGFGNRIARLIAEDLHASLRYVWAPERRGFLRRAFQEAGCDMVPAIPSGLPGVSATRPYFASGYVIVRKRSLPPIQSFDDPALRRLRIGLPLLGAEGTNIPAARSLATRGLADRVVGFPVWHFDSTRPQSGIVDAVAAGRIDLAILWGPFAGYFASPHGRALALDPVPADPAQPGLPATYAIAVGVRPGADALRDEIDGALARRAGTIHAMIAAYNVPLYPLPTQTGETDR